MRRVLIIGSAGAGKTTLARQIGTRLDLPVIHLDRHFWNPGWVETPRDEWARQVDELVAGDRWVMDGNYGGTIDRRIRAADTVLFLDYSRVLCLGRVLRRWWRHRGRQRPDLPEGCLEKIDAEFLLWIWNYRRRSRPRIVDALDRFGEGRRIETLSNPAEARALLEALSERAPLGRDGARTRLASGADDAVSTIDTARRRRDASRSRSPLNPGDFSDRA
jgi:adenylate kinase family enzyme